MLCPCLIVATILAFILIAIGEQTKDADAVPKEIQKIIRGSDAADNQFPYQISLRKVPANLQHICGGTIIGPSKVLTAAHCVTTPHGRPMNPRNYKILAGTRYLRISSTDGFLYSVRYIVIHPRYSSRRLVNDVAVIIIDGEFDFELPSMAPMMYDNGTDIADGTECIVSGWGKTETGYPAQILQFVSVKIINLHKCRRMYTGAVGLTRSMVCAKGGQCKGSAQGDSGGPLVCDNRLIGVVSFGGSQILNAIPDVYAYVPYLSKWIRNNLGSSVAVRSMVLIFYPAAVSCWMGI